MRGPGKRKVLFGTNFPMLTPAQCMKDLDSLGLDDEVRALFLAGNAARLFNLELGGGQDDEGHNRGGSP